MFNCRVRVVIVERALADSLKAEIAALGTPPAMIELDTVGGGRGLAQALDALEKTSPAQVAATHRPTPDQLAYILYTSGSTGLPKGVMLTHANAMAFVDWCVRTFEPTSTDRFSSHAPFHFDLSILDLYACCRRQATLVLIPEDLGKAPGQLAELIEERKITIWYSTPTILSLLAQFGDLEGRSLAHLRLILFAGEVFPIRQLHDLVAKLPGRRYANLYGPTETNVCTWYEFAGALDPGIIEPLPIGRVCDHLEGVVVDEAGTPVAAGDEGELVMRGANVTGGYWERPDITEAAFFSSRAVTAADGAPFYRTGDLVIEEAGGNLRYVGRRDRMVKKRGYRIELGEIEAALYRHPSIMEAAAIARNAEDSVEIVAHLATSSGERMSIIALKKFCADNLPSQMVPDRFQFHDVLPKTSTDKMDYQSLLGAS